MAVGRSYASRCSPVFDRSQKSLEKPGFWLRNMRLVLQKASLRRSQCCSFEAAGKSKVEQSTFLAAFYFKDFEHLIGEQMRTAWSSSFGTILVPDKGKEASSPRAHRAPRTPALLPQPAKKLDCEFRNSCPSNPINYIPPPGITQTYG